MERAVNEHQVGYLPLVCGRPGDLDAKEPLVDASRKPWRPAIGMLLHDSSDQDVTGGDSAFWLRSDEELALVSPGRTDRPSYQAARIHATFIGDGLAGKEPPSAARLNMVSRRPRERVRLLARLRPFQKRWYKSDAYGLGFKIALAERSSSGDAKDGWRPSSAIDKMVCS